MMSTSQPEARMRVDIVRGTIVAFLASLLLFITPSETLAQNTSNGSSFGYIVGQGPINIFIGNTVGTDTERWYTTQFVQGKSYCIELFRANSEYNVDLDINVQVISPPSTVLFTFDNHPMGGDPGLGDNSRWTRGCFIPTLATQAYWIRMSRSVCCTGRTGNLQFNVSETTLFSPWWFVNSSSGYNAFFEIANISTVAVNIEVTIRQANGAIVGTKQVRSIPAFGNIALSAATDFGTTVTAASGSVQLSHDGPPGAIVANTTSLSALQGLSFDSPFLSRQGYR
jgi:hypothetical protein